MSFHPSVETVAAPALTPKQYKAFADLVYQLTRVNLGTEKQELVAARICKRLRKLGLPSYQAYLDLLETPAREAEIPHLIEVITTHHTYFYREENHFAFLAEHIVPEFNRTMPQKTWRFWSAACSTGEEPVTIAITLAEAGVAPARWELVGTDIAPTTVEKASAGIFKRSGLTRFPPHWRAKYFQMGTGQSVEYCRIVPSLRRSMKFSTLNLASSYRWEHPFDVVFLRNVMIYFDRQTQFEVLTQVLRSMRPNAYLITGQSESLAGHDLPLKSLRPSIYQLTS